MLSLFYRQLFWLWLACALAVAASKFWFWAEFAHHDQPACGFFKFLRETGIKINNGMIVYSGNLIDQSKGSYRRDNNIISRGGNISILLVATIK